jgi:hypothetical protein
MKSEFILGDVLNKLQYSQPTKIYIDFKKDLFDRVLGGNHEFSRALYC